jgi:YgiT-type zinc finger domain-containing protein
MIVSRCAICGGKVEEREIREEVKIRNDFVVIENVRAGVCVECGERYYPPVIGSTYRLTYDAPF